MIVKTYDPSFFLDHPHSPYYKVEVAETVHEDSGIRKRQRILFLIHYNFEKKFWEITESINTVFTYTF